MKIKVTIKQNLRLDTADLRTDDYKFDEKLPKKQIGKYRGYKVYEVDGNYVRNNIDIDFVGGGNPARYQYVPEGELWIERLGDNEKTDVMGFIKHEYTECERMKKLGETYEEAHEVASEVEKKLRKKIDKEEK